MARGSSKYWEQKATSVIRIGNIQINQFADAGVVQFGNYSERLGRPSSQVGLHLDQLTVPEMQQLKEAVCKIIDEEAAGRMRMAMTPAQFENWMRAVAPATPKSYTPDGDAAAAELLK